MEKFNNIIETIKNLAILTIGLLTVAYWYSYDFEVRFKEKVLNNSYWFYVGIWTPSGVYIDNQYQIHMADHDPDTGHLINGNVVRSEAETIVGRTEAGISAGKVRYVGEKNDCLHVLESNDIALKANKNSSKPVKNECGNDGCSAIWVRAVPKMCG